MIIKQIILDDFHIFYGKQKLELGPGLYVIHGENGRGKSTFLNAITWVFFGEYLNRQGETVSSSVMLNREASLEGKTTFSVELHLVDGADKIRVKRSFDTSDQAAGARLAVDRNGAPLSQDAAERLLRALLDQDVSRFFLFDGEDLRRYEELLFGESTAASEVRRSIEHILGLPALTNAVNDLEHVAEDFAAAAVKAARKETSAQQAALKAEQIKKELTDAEDDLQGLLDNQDELNDKVAAATAILQQHEASSELIKKKVEVETKIQGLKDEQAKDRDLRAEAFSHIWKDVLAAAVKPERDKLAQTLADEQQRQRWQQEASEIETALQVNTCGHCGQALHGDAEQQLRTRLTELQSKPKPASGGLAEVAQSLTKLAAITPTGHITQAINLDRQVGTDASKISQLEQQLQDLTKDAAGIPEAALRDATKQRDEVNKLLGINGEKIKDQKAAIAEHKANLKVAREQVEKASTSQQAAELRAREALARDLAANFEHAKDQFRDAMREKVGADASAIFSSLTSSPEYKGLRINENYGLTTLGPDGNPVPGRSAGQEQIVAFALIGALNLNATRTAPVIMDTPLGRLDKTHKAKVLAHLAEFAEQVFLLVHSGEVPDEFLIPIRNSIVAEYELHPEDLFRTQIRKLVNT